MIPAEINKPVVLRAEAKAAGLKSYFNGKECPAGHIADRSTINGACCECARLKRKAKYHANIEAERAEQKLRRDSDPLCAEKKMARRLKRDPGLAVRKAERERRASLRQAAMDAGLMFYSIGLPCVNGHSAERYVSTDRCRTCEAISAAAKFGMTLEECEKGKAERKRISEERSSRMAEVAARRKERRTAKSARKIALESGSLMYVGRPCSKGHSGTKYTASGSCVECLAIFSRSELKKEYDRKYLIENRDRIIQLARIRNEQNREVRAQKAKEWAKKNPEIRKAISKAYKARRRQLEAGGDSTSVIMAWERSTPKYCHWCKSKCENNYHVDHYQPLSKGGMHVVDNLVIACPPCNLRKSAKDPYEFAASLGRLF